MKELTGAKLFVMEGDAEIVESGGEPETAGAMPPAKVDRVLHDKDEVRLGGNTLTAYLTPGHTRGNTTWLWTAQEGGLSYTVNLMGSLSLNDARLLVSPTHPDLVEQYRRAYRVLKSLPCDVFLSAHDKFLACMRSTPSSERADQIHISTLEGLSGTHSIPGVELLLQVGLGQQMEHPLKGHCPRKMPYRSALAVALLVRVLPGSLSGQRGQGAFPTEVLPPIIVPWELGGEKYKLHTRDQDSASFPAHQIIGNVYYVGQADYASYLITTPQGHILIDSTYESEVPLIQKSVEQLKFRFQDIKILLITHAHRDHSGGAWRVKELTGAQLMVMDQDASAIEKGGTDMRPVKVDRVLHDKDEVQLGGVKIVAYRTPGHTPGNTTYVWKASQSGSSYTVVLPGSLSSNARALAAPETPTLVEDYRYTFRFLKSLPCDVYRARMENSLIFLKNTRNSKKGEPTLTSTPMGTGRTSN